MSKEDKAREAVCALGVKLAARGLCPGTSGNISVFLLGSMGCLPALIDAKEEPARGGPPRSP